MTAELASITRRIKRDRALGAQRYKQVGRDLIDVKSKLAHGEWLPWLKKNFDMTPRRAQQLMSACRSKSEDVSYLDELNLWTPEQNQIIEADKEAERDAQPGPVEIVDKPRPLGRDAADATVLRRMDRVQPDDLLPSRPSWIGALLYQMQTGVDALVDAAPKFSPEQRAECRTLAQRLLDALDSSAETSAAADAEQKEVMTTRTAIF